MSLVMEKAATISFSRHHVNFTKTNYHAPNGGVQNDAPRGQCSWGGVRFESIVHIRAQRTVSEYRRVSQIN